MEMKMMHWKRGLAIECRSKSFFQFSINFNSLSGVNLYRFIYSRFISENSNLDLVF